MQLTAAITALPESPEAWWALLRREEELATAAAGASPAIVNRVTRNGVSLFDLYRWATKVVPRQNNYKNEAFISLWLGFARQQW